MRIAEVVSKGIAFWRALVVVWRSQKMRNLRQFQCQRSVKVLTRHKQLVERQPEWCRLWWQFCKCSFSAGPTFRGWRQPSRQVWCGLEHVLQKQKIPMHLAWWQQRIEQQLRRCLVVWANSTMNSLATQQTNQVGQGAMSVASMAIDCP